MHNKELHFDTQTIHGGRVDDTQYGSLVTPLYLTSAYIFDSTQQGADRFAGKEPGFFYSRMGNPTVMQLENRLAILEGTEAAAATASGMGAISCALLANLQSGDHIISSKALYGCTYKLMDELMVRFGVETTFVDMTENEQILAAMQDNTKIIFAETPVNPNLGVIDLSFISQLAKEKNILSIVDNTFMTPMLQKPVEFGIDIIVHSATKYLNGHGDVIAGVICASEEHIQRIKSTTLKDLGAPMSPHDAWLILRGLKTLHLRMERHCSNAQIIAEYLETQTKVKQVYYPGLASHPGHRFIGQQMRHGGGVIAFELNADIQQSQDFIHQLQLFTLAVSLGDGESLIQHPASMTHSGYTQQEREAADISDSLIRIAVGLEHDQDLLADLEQAFTVVR